jgi:hypothetical protein
MKHSKNFLSRKLDVTYDNPTSKRGQVVEYPVYEYTVSIDMKDGSPASFAAAEQEVRNLVTGTNKPCEYQAVLRGGLPTFEKPDSVGICQSSVGLPFVV